MGQPVSTIELFRNDMKFCAAHFTIFNGKERERLHGHNYYVRSRIRASYIEPGITYDYTITRKEILKICRELNEYMLLPLDSPYLEVSEKDGYVRAIFDGVEMSFLAAETRLMPIANVTSEELARYFVEKLWNDEDIRQKKIHSLEIEVSTTQGQSASYTKSVSEGTL